MLLQNLISLDQPTYQLYILSIESRVTCMEDFYDFKSDIKWILYTDFCLVRLELDLHDKNSKTAL